MMQSLPIAPGFDYAAAQVRALAEIVAAHGRSGKALSSAKRADFAASLAVSAAYGETQWDVMVERALLAAGIGFHWDVDFSEGGAGEFKPGKGFLRLTESSSS